jgi:hypothetical protein
MIDEPTPTSPIGIAKVLESLWRDNVTDVRITESLLGWSVEVRVKLLDGRKRETGFSEYGETRIEAICKLLRVAELEGFAEIYGITKR